MVDQFLQGRFITQRFVPIALLCSIGLNVFFVGAWVGAGLRRPLLPPPGGPLWELERQLQGRLTPDGMHKVDSLIQEIDAGLRHQFDASEALRRQLHIILVSEPFNSSAFLQRLNQLNDGRASFDSGMAKHIAELIASLSPDDRRLFADAVLSMPPRPPLG